MINAINKSPAKNIIITHGTYTMPDTARFIASRIKNNTKIIILTGSMIPLLGFSPSDAGFNLGFALGQFDSLTPGVYVAMNGQIFTPLEVVKLVSQGRFSSILNK
jgi:L-asparaginase